LRAVSSFWTAGSFHPDWQMTLPWLSQTYLMVCFRFSGLQGWLSMSREVNLIAAVKPTVTVYKYHRLGRFLPEIMVTVGLPKWLKELC
jgi:hypothetical protein